MPLHDWDNLAGWEGVHNIWIVELLRWVKPRLPEGFRAFIGTAPALAVGTPPERPGVAVRQWSVESPQVAVGSPVGSEATGSFSEPDEEVATLLLDPETAVFVTAWGRLIAAIELVSPRNKDRPSARATYLARYLNYLHEGANLLLVDVHRRPLGFSFADRLAAELDLDQVPCPAPSACSYRVGERAASGGRMLARWRRPLEVGSELPMMPLPLTVNCNINVSLEATYARAAADAYLS